MFAKVGRPIFGMYLKIGQNGTRVGRYLKKVTKNGTSFMNVPLQYLIFTFGVFTRMRKSVKSAACVFLHLSP